MTPSRNDLCPCGSGRKYKHCCMQKDEAARSASRPLMGIDDEEWGQAADAPAWDAGIVTLGVRIEDQPGSRYAAVMVAAGGLVLDNEMVVDPSAEPDDVADLLEAALRRAAGKVGTWPEIVVVRHSEVADVLRERLADLGVQVMHHPDLVDFDDAAASLRTYMGDDRPVQVNAPPDSFLAWGLGDDWVRDLFASAAFFLRQAPWDRLEDDQTLFFETPAGRTWHAAVFAPGEPGLNVGGGLSLCSSTADFLILAGGGVPPGEQPLFQGRSIGIDFDTVGNQAPLARREVEEAGWEVAAPDGWPHLWTINTPAGGLGRQDAEDLVAALRFLPVAVEAMRGALRARREGSWEDPGEGIRVRYDPSPPSSRSSLDDGVELPTDAAYQAMHHRIQQRIEAEQAADLETVQRITGEEFERYNHTPQEELGGLAPARVSALLTASWEDPDGPVRFHTDLPFEAFAASADVHNTRTLLLAVEAEEGGLRATATGNLPRGLVNRLREELTFGGYWRTAYDQDIRLRSEDDFIPLMDLRQLLEFAGLLALRKNRWVVTGQGRELLQESAAGRLLYHLLEVQFNRLELAGLDGFPLTPEFQDTFFYTLYRLHGLDDTLRVQEELPDLLLLPTMRPSIDAAFEDSEQLSRAFAHRILDRLAQAGLAERTFEIDRVRRKTVNRYRPAPLLRRFISFRE